jgi:hypothetical protein
LRLVTTIGRPRLSPRPFRPHARISTRTPSGQRPAGTIGGPSRASAWRDDVLRDQPDFGARELG